MSLDISFWKEMFERFLFSHFHQKNVQIKMTTLSSLLILISLFLIVGCNWPASSHCNIFTAKPPKSGLAMSMQIFSKNQFYLALYER